MIIQVKYDQVYLENVVFMVSVAVSKCNLKHGSQKGDCQKNRGESMQCIFFEYLWLVKELYFHCHLGWTSEPSIAKRCLEWPRCVFFQQDAFTTENCSTQCCMVLFALTTNFVEFARSILVS